MLPSSSSRGCFLLPLLLFLLLPAHPPRRRHSAVLVLAQEEERQQAKPSLTSWVLQGICQELSHATATSTTNHPKAAALVCPHDLQDAVRHLSPVFVAANTTTNKFGSPAYLQWYPSSFLVRPLVLPDDYETHFQPKMSWTQLKEYCGGDAHDERPLLLLQVSSNSTTINTDDSSQHTTTAATTIADDLLPIVQVSKLADWVVPKGHDDHNSQDNFLTKLQQGADEFHTCCQESLAYHYTRPAEKDVHKKEDAKFRSEFVQSVVTWRKSSVARQCKAQVEDQFEDISNQIASYVQQGNYTAYLQAIRWVSVVYGQSPSLLAHLILLLGCPTDDSYDEFLSCDIRLGSMVLNANIFQRGATVAVDEEDGSVRLVEEQEEPWQCHTCTIHQVNTILREAGTCIVSCFCG